MASFDPHCPQVPSDFCHQVHLAAFLTHQAIICAASAIGLVRMTCVPVEAPASLPTGRVRCAWFTRFKEIPMRFFNMLCTIGVAVSVPAVAQEPVPDVPPPTESMTAAQQMIYEGWALTNRPPMTAGQPMRRNTSGRCRPPGRSCSFACPIMTSWPWSQCPKKSAMPRGTSLKARWKAARQAASRPRSSRRAPCLPRQKCDNTARLNSSGKRV